MDDKERESTRRINLECAIKVKKEPSRKLRDILVLCSECYLEDYYSVITGEMVSFDDKLIDNIYDKLTDIDVIKKFLNSLSVNEFNILMNIVDNGGCIQDDYIKYLDYSYISRFGVVYTFNYKNKLYIVMPEEIVNVIKEIDTDSYNDIVMENSIIIDLATAMGNLYGVVPAGVFGKALDEYYGITDINLDCILYAKRNNGISCIKYDDDNLYFVGDDFFEEDYKGNVFKIIDNYNDILCDFDFKEIECEELIKYKDIFYYSKSKSSEQFADYLTGYGLDEEGIEDIIASIVQTYKSDYVVSISLLSDIFSEYDVVLNESNYDELMVYVNNLVNDIPMWGNKGWTNKEIILGKAF